MTNWEIAKSERLRQVGYVCEICGKPGTRNDWLIGHHILGRKYQRANNLETAEYCEIRHQSCEAEMHKLYKTGNYPNKKATA